MCPTQDPNEQGFVGEDEESVFVREEGEEGIKSSFDDSDSEPMAPHYDRGYFEAENE